MIIRTITEVSEILKVSTSTIRHWERYLKLEIPKDKSGNRVINEKILTKLERIKRLRDRGLTMRAIERELRKRTKVKFHGTIKNFSKRYRKASIQSLTIGNIGVPIKGSDEAIKKAHVRFIASLNNSDNHSNLEGSQRAFAVLFQLYVNAVEDEIATTEMLDNKKIEIDDFLSDITTEIL